MRDAFAVRGSQTACDLYSIVDRIAPRQRSAFYQLAHRMAFEQLRNHIGRAVVKAHLVHRENVGMIQRGRGPRLLSKAPKAIGIIGQERRQYFDGNVSRQAQVSRLINLAHPAGADELMDFVVANSCPRLQRYRINQRFAAPASASEMRRSEAPSCVSSDSTSRRTSASSAQALSRKRTRSSGLRSTASRKRLCTRCHFSLMVSTRLEGLVGQLSFSRAPPNSWFNSRRSHA